MFRRIWNWWKGVARKIGDFQARILLGIFYFLILGPFALLINWRGDLLSIKPKRKQRGWLERPAKPPITVDQAIKQF